ncbi:MAG: hypothetical protein ACOCX4_03100 [Planctomycetota bacterium]
MGSEPTMELSPALTQRIAKWRAFHADPTPGQILCTVTTWNMDLDLTPFGVEDRPVNGWDYRRERRALAENTVRALRGRQQLLRELDLDDIPFVSPGVGIATHSLYLSGGEMVMDEHNTWAHPVLHQWNQVDTLRPDPEREWFRFLEEMDRHFVDLADGDYAVQTFGHFGPSDMANALRGNDLFLDVYDAPDQVDRLLQRCVEAGAWLERRLRTLVPPTEGGRVIWGAWLPGDPVFQSEDASDLCAPATYRDLFRPHTEAFAAAFDGCFIHHHARGLHVHPDIAAVRGLRMVEVSLDPNCDRPIDRLPELYEANRDLPLMTRATPADIHAHIDRIKEGRIFLSIDVPTLSEAKETIAFLRRHSRL